MPALMKRCPILLLLLLCAATHSFSQVTTPDFTHYTSCPKGLSELNKCIGWYQPTGGTTDYFNACSTGKFVGVPKNFAGYQQSDNNTYVGLVTYYPDYSNEYKEYIGTNFPALTVGQTYTMTISVSLADSSAYATDGLGVYFTTYAINNYSGGTMPVTPQVDYSSYGVIADTANWITLTKSFVADSPYTHLIVGCFKPWSIMKIDSVGNGGQEKFSYYYIDRIGDPDPDWHGLTDTITHPGQYNINYAFPTAFTPNGDGLNDYFHIMVSRGLVLEDYAITIFNRQGQRVYFSETRASAWDGKYNGSPAPAGVYYYYAHFKVNGKDELIKGDVTLVR